MTKKHNKKNTETVPVAVSKAEKESAAPSKKATKKSNISEKPTKKTVSEEYQPGSLSDMLSSKEIDSKAQFEVNSDDEEIEVDSEVEKSWNPYESDSEMDEKLDGALKQMSDNPDKWMKKLELEMNDSEEVSDSEMEEEEENEGNDDEEEKEDESEEESESKEGEEMEGMVEEDNEEEEESEEEEEKEEIKVDSEEKEEEEESEESEETKTKKETKREKEQRLKQEHRDQLKDQGKDEKEAIKNIITTNSIFVNGIPFNCTEQQFRDVFSDCGTIRNVFFVRRNNGTLAGYGAVEFESAAEAKAARKLDGKDFMGRKLGIKALESTKVLDRQANRKEQKKLKREAHQSAKKEKFSKKKQFVKRNQNKGRKGGQKH